MFSVSEMAGGDESIRAPETRHGRVGPERYWLDNDSAVKEAGPVEGRLAGRPKSCCFSWASTFLDLSL